VIPFSCVVVAPTGFGGSWIDQVEPFHASASAKVSVPLLYEPTAMHAVDDVHATWLSCEVVAPPGFGVVWTDQLEPSHVSASVTVLVPSKYEPTAMQAVEDVHDTPLSDSGRPTFGGAWFVHVDPFLLSARRVVAAAFVVAPTAMQKPPLPVTHETALKFHVFAPGSSAVSC
jgi:hypothetical protein